MAFSCMRACARVPCSARWGGGGGGGYDVKDWRPTGGGHSGGQRLGGLGLDLLCLIAGLALQPLQRLLCWRGLGQPCARDVSLLGVSGMASLRAFLHVWRQGATVGCRIRQMHGKLLAPLPQCATVVFIPCEFLFILTFQRCVDSANIEVLSLRTRLQS